MFGFDATPLPASRTKTIRKTKLSKDEMNEEASSSPVQVILSLLPITITWLLIHTSVL